MELPPDLKPGLVALPLREQPVAAQAGDDAVAYQRAERILLEVGPLCLGGFSPMYSRWSPKVLLQQKHISPEGLSNPRLESAE